MEKTIYSFPIWKVIRTTKYKDVTDVERLLKQRGCQIGAWANSVIRSSAFTSEQNQKVKLVAVSGYDLGFTRAVSRIDIYKRAIDDFNLDLSLPGDSVDLRSSYLDQPNEEIRIMAMEPIKDLKGLPYVLVLKHDNYGLWLIAYHDRPGYNWGPGVIWIFRCRKGS